MSTFNNVTLYTSNEFMGNYTGFKCKFVTVEIKPYAQYKAAVHVTFLEKGKRNPRSFVQGYKPSVVIADGWNCPEPPPLYSKTIRSDASATVMESTHQSFGAGWEADFKATVYPHVTLIADYHGHQS